ncbi:hypothetical protein pb186bvf_004064 [Paramecium bursaria]
MISIKLLTKQGCTLCEQAVFPLQRLKLIYPDQLRITKVYIENKKEFQQYIDKVPVILVNDEPICVTEICERELRLAINKIRHM